MYLKNNTKRTGIKFLRKENVVPHLGKLNFKALHKQKSRLSMRRNQGKPGYITREEFDSNWDKIFNKEKSNAKKKNND